LGLTMPISALIVIGLFGIYLMLRGRRATPEASRGPLPDGDAATLDELAHAGSDLSRQHTIEFFLYLPDQAAAEAVAAGLRSEGLTVDVNRAADGADWLCLIRQRMVPDMAGLRSWRVRLTALAEAHQGQYDGWGTEVEGG
jgi:regulator of RNase E activity RraB